VRSSPAYYNGTLYVGSDDGQLYALNATSGELIWNYYIGNPIRSSALIEPMNNNLFVGSDDGNMTCLDTRNGELKWSYKAGGPVRSTPALFDNKITFGSNDGTVYVLNKYTGQQEWSYMPGYYIFNSPFSSSPAVYGQTVYIGGEDGYMYVLNADKEEGPTSIFVYYIIAIAAVLIGILLFIRIFRGRMAKKE